MTNDKHSPGRRTFNQYWMRKNRSGPPCSYAKRGVTRYMLLDCGVSAEISGKAGIVGCVGVIECSL